MTLNAGDHVFSPHFPGPDGRRRRDRKIRPLTPREIRRLLARVRDGSCRIEDDERGIPQLVFVKTVE